MQLSKTENLAYETLRKNTITVFKIKDLCLLMNIDRTKAYNLIKALKKKEAIKQAGKGYLALKEVDDFSIATIINSPSYISFWTALNYYGFSDQTPKVIFLATTKYSKNIGNFKYAALNKKRFFGYTSIGNIVIAEKEKGLIDSLIFPKYAGGIKEVKASIEKAIKEININKLINYALKVESKAVLRRLGYILENLKVATKYHKVLMKNIGKGYELLDPTMKRRNNLNKKWLLDINIK